MTGTEFLGDEWVPLIEAANIRGIHPESMRRLWRYGRLPHGAVVRLGNVLFFNKSQIEASTKGKVHAG